MKKRGKATELSSQSPLAGALSDPTRRKTGVGEKMGVVGVEPSGKELVGGGGVKIKSP